MIEKCTSRRALVESGEERTDKSLLLLLGLALLDLKRDGEREGKSAKTLQLNRRQDVVAPLPNLDPYSQS